LKQAEAATTATATRTVGTLADIPLGIPVARRTAETITGNQ
jgi:hypothetical protein